MGRYLKNTQLEGGSYAIQLPLGSNSVGPDVPVDGHFRYNQDNSRIEFYVNSSWRQVAKIGTVSIVVDEFAGDGGQVTFTITISPPASAGAAAAGFGASPLPGARRRTFSTTTTFERPWEKL
jgi:hypothetical protein